MKNLRENRPRYIFKSIVLPAILGVLLLGVLALGVWRFNVMSLEQDRELTCAALKKAAVQCYADEGRYPADVEYLYEHYGVHVDTDEFFVNYNCAASNVFPNITVTRR